ncbi:uncharacterized protein YlxP (DUF503 family) [Pullulanibacillus pueri]|uniref:DUF503 domain-containing protein n=1 Tax=Pullulanibacillus pueri TaxID=1437324 RepID=A0A8J2ZW82_9BACL|nr:DUF503 domain-containing protein [Pullulanibacillus pueri]MBM7682519.1 uncharacterized protein YlxP (DUF503 family) [Pullulanibacillus pueri]GGH82077.1 hypothetical protein GCM10007096_20920 [Pullulanibacillus pueri]
MIIGSLRCECLLYNAQSLKDKRSVIKSILGRTISRLNVACSEVGYQDTWQRTELAFVAVSTSKKVVEQEFAKVLRLIDQNTEIEITNTTFEWL